MRRSQAAEAGIDALVHSGSEGPIWELLEEDARDRFPWGDFGGYLRAWLSRRTVSIYKAPSWAD